MLNLSGSELTNYLQSLRSDDIAKIEVITRPPSKYEAQGNSGIINIILKKNPNLGWSGSLNGSYQRNSYNGFRTGATVNYQSEKISSSLKLSQGDINYKRIGSRNLIGNETGIYSNESVMYLFHSAKIKDIPLYGRIPITILFYPFCLQRCP